MPNIKPKSERLEKRADNKMAKAKKAYGIAEDVKKNLDTSSQRSVDLGVGYANSQYDKSQRLAAKAKALKTKALEVKRKQDIKAAAKPKKK
jgi:hypothetical protein